MWRLFQIRYMRFIDKAVLQISIIQNAIEINSKWTFVRFARANVIAVSKHTWCFNVSTRRVAAKQPADYDRRKYVQRWIFVLHVVSWISQKLLYVFISYIESEIDNKRTLFCHVQFRFGNFCHIIFKADVEQIFNFKLNMAKVRLLSISDSIYEIKT